MTDSYNLNKDAIPFFDWKWIFSNPKKEIHRMMILKIARS